jgi:hypothetical protein
MVDGRRSGGWACAPGRVLASLAAMTALLVLSCVPKYEDYVVDCPGEGVPIDGGETVGGEGTVHGPDADLRIADCFGDQCADVSDARDALDACDADGQGDGSILPPIDLVQEQKPQEDLADLPQPDGQDVQTDENETASEVEECDQCPADLPPADVGHDEMPSDADVAGGTDIAAEADSGADEEGQDGELPSLCKNGECNSELGENCSSCPADCKCLDGQSCQDGICTCQPACDGKQCGDDGCKGECGACPGAQDLCVEGQCVCQPACAGKQCGDDGCKGECGTCLGAQDLCVEGQCICQPACAGKQCGTNGCGGNCGPMAGACPGLQDACVAGICVCQPACDGKPCGDDGCGGTCGPCDDAVACTLDVCSEAGQCTHNAVDAECDDSDACTGDTCDAVLGCQHAQVECDDENLCTTDDCLAATGCTHVVVDCDDDESCTKDTCAAATGCGHAKLADGTSCDVWPLDGCKNGKCECLPDCTGKQCGPDGCGGICGECSQGYACVDGLEDTGATWCKCATPSVPTQWEYKYGAKEYPGLYQGGHSVVAMPDGGYVVAGFRNIGPPDYSISLWVVRTDAQGTKLWERTFPSGNKNGGGNDVSAARLTDGRLGLLTSAGGAAGEKRNWRLYVVQDAPNPGDDKQWDYNYGGDDIPSRVIPLPGGGLALAGDSWAADASIDAQLIFLDASLKEVGKKVFTGPALKRQVINDIRRLDTGGYVLVGDASKEIPPGVDPIDAWLMVTDGDGNPLAGFPKTFGGNKYDTFFSVVLLPTGGFAMAGRTHSFGNGDADVWLVVTDKDGKEVWNRTYGGPGEENGYALSLTPDSGFAVAYHLRNGPSNLVGSDTGLLRTTSDGTELWTTILKYVGNPPLSEPPLLEDQAYDLLVTANEEFVVVGDSGPNALPDYYDMWFTKVGPLECPCGEGCVPAQCGNGKCQADVGETCASCEKDCGSCCGNGVCDPTEDKCDCPSECGDPCEGKQCGDDGCGGSCGTCDLPDYCDNHQCVPTCPNGWCDYGETCASCPADCAGCCAAEEDILCANRGDCVPGAEKPTCVCKKGYAGDSCEVVLPGGCLASKSFGGTGYDAARSMAMDVLDNIYVVGQFHETVSFGGAAHTSSGDDDIFVSKYGPDLSWVWDKEFGGGGEDTGYDISLGPSGDVFVGGYFNQAIDFGNGEMSCPGHCGFGARLTLNGQGTWSWKMPSGNGGGYVYAVAADSSNGPVLAGHLAGTVDFGGGPKSADGVGSCGGWGTPSALFVNKLEASGTYAWDKVVGHGCGQSIVEAVAVDKSNNVIAAGRLAGYGDFGGGERKSDLQQNNCGVYICGDIFVAKYGQNGAYQWDRVVGTGVSDSARAVALDSDNNIIVAGSYGDGFINFGEAGDTLPTSGSSNAFLVKLAPDGSHLWSRSFGAKSSSPNAVAVDGDDNVIAVGWFSGTVDFGGGPLTTLFPENVNESDVYVAKFDPDGNHIWSRSFPSAGQQDAYDVKADEAEGVFVVGGFLTSVDFGCGPLASQGDWDFFVLKLKP